jgi:hypothetical protein
MAMAYSFNVTVVPSGPLGWLTMWPTGSPRPHASTLNAPDGRITANAAIMPSGTDGSVDVFVTDTTHVVIDLNGYFVDSRSIETPLETMTLASWPPFTATGLLTTASRFLWEPTRYGRPPAEIYLEVAGSLQAAGSATIRLRNLANNASIGAVTINSTTMTRVRSGNLANSFPGEQAEIAVMIEPSGSYFTLSRAAILITR